MKSLREYIAESEHAAGQPVTGDYFEINIREETLFETWVCGETEDGFVIHADETGMKLLEDYGYLDTEVIAEDQKLDELSPDLLNRAAQAARAKRNKSLEPEIHDALGGGYMNPLAQTL